MLGPSRNNYLINLLSDMACLCCCAAWVLLVFIILAIAWKVNDAARYYLKFFLFALIAVTFATCPIPLMLLNPKSSKNAL